MRKKRFLSIAVSLLFVLQIFISFAPLKSVKADTSTFPLVTENTSTSQGESGGDTETATDQDGSVTQEGTDSQKNIEQDNTTKDSDNTAQQGAEETNGSSENGTQLEETDSQQNADQKSGSDTSKSEGNATTEPEQNSTTQDSGTTAEQTETPAQEEPADSDPAVTPTVIEFPFITGGTLTDGTGKDISAETDVDKSSDVNINYDFSIPEGQTASADTPYSIQFTDQIKVKDVSSELKSSDGTVIGSINADSASNKVTVAFTIEVKSGTSGKLSISGQFNNDKIGNSNPVSVNIGKTSVDVNFKQEEAEQQNPAQKPGEAVQTKPGEQAADSGAVIATQAVGSEIPEPTQDITDTFADSGDDSFIKSVVITNQDGSPLASSDIPKNAPIAIKYTFGIQNGHAVNNGDTYTMRLPAEINIAVDNAPIDAQNGQLGSLTISGGIATITFTDYASKHSNVGGDFTLSCNFAGDSIQNSTPVPITFNLKGTGVPYTQDVYFKQPDPTIQKDVVNVGSATKGYNPADDTITWQITVNKEGVEVDNAKVIDIINPGQTYVDGSASGATVVKDTTADGKERLTFTLDNPITAQKVITFKTSVHDDLADKISNTTYSNQATLQYGDIALPKTADSNTASVTVPVNLISKDGSYDAENKQINWTITVNSSGRNLHAVNVADVTTITGQTGLTVSDPTNISVTDGSTAKTYTKSGSAGNINFDLGDIGTEKRVIKFSTPVDPKAYNSNTTANYNNKAILTSTDITGEVSASKNGIGVGTDIISKNGSYNASNGRITWTITVNNNKTAIYSDATVTDIIPAGLSYVPGTATVGGLSEESIISGQNLSYTFPAADLTSQTQTIQFQTQVDDPKTYQANKSTSFTNTAYISNSQIDNQPAPKIVGVTSNVIDKLDNSGYDYSNRQTTWRIVVNRNKMPITGAVVTDNIPKGQKYVPGSAKIVDGDNGLASAAASTVAQGSFTEPSYAGDFGKAGDSGDNGTLNYTFTNTVADGNTYTIIYKTELVDLNIFDTNGQKTLYNTASISGDGIESTGVTEDTAHQDIQNSVITKVPIYTSGKNYIDWTVKTNANWSIPLPGKTITDKLQSGLSLDTNSVKLYSATVNPDGSISKSDEITGLNAGNIHYDTTPDADGKTLFEFTFPSPLMAGGVDVSGKPFILKFRTYVTAPGSYSNTVTFDGTGFNQSSSADASNVNFTTIDSGAYGETGDIKIVKVDKDNNAIKLPDAVFQLFDQFGYPRTDPSDGTTTATSGFDGSAIFKYLQYNINYSIKETTAPQGYNSNSNEYTFSLDSTGNPILNDPSGVFTYNGKDSDGNYVFNFEDTRKTGNAAFTKTGEDSDSAGLSGAVFTLYKADGTTSTGITATSGSDGKVTFANVPFGYKIKETTAPIGYSKSTQTLIATVDGSGNVVLDADSIADTKIRNNVTFTKEDQSGNPLEGAEFKLYKNDDATFANPVQTVTSAVNGQVTFNNAAYGYKIKETKAPTGYYLSSKVLTAEMNAANDGVILDAAEFKDTKIVYTIQGTVSVKKIDESGNPLKGAEFTLFNSAGSLVQASLTGDDGIAQFNYVQPGQYTVKETKAPEGYSLSSKVISVDVNESKTYDLGTVADQKALGSIEISKSDFSTQAPVPGATITVYRDAALTDVVGSKVTGSDGKVVFDNLPYGHYYFKETNAPEGYQLNTDVHQFDISEDAKNVKDTITDEKISDNSFNIQLTADPKSITGDGKSTSTLTAKVVDADNKPVPGVTVEFSAPNGSFPEGSSAVTDENGEASVVFKSDKIEGTEEKKIPVTAVVNDPEHGLNAKDQIDITFDPGSIKGTVVDNETGDPIAGAKVVVEKDFDGDGTIDFTSEVTTSADGKYEIAVPKGDVEYEVHITVPVQINGKTEDKTFIQKSNPGDIAGNSYDSEKTAAGIVLLKNPDGETGDYFKDYGNITIDVPEIGQQVDIGSDGTFQVGGLEKDREYNFNIVYHFDTGEQIIIGTIHVKMDSDGQMRIDPEPTLIDPYGVVTDSVTGDKIPDADIKLYYADTERNRESGKTPDTLVQLPGLEGFPPADNANPQSSDEEGNYAFMVYPNTDYYIVATKPGYETETTETISVNDAVVKHDIEMDPISSGGAGGGGSASIRGKVNVKKTDKSGNPLKGAEFTLINSKGNSVKTVVTDENGLAEFTKVNPGKYTVKETKAPSGYSISDKILSVEINQSKVYDLGTVQDAKEEGSTPVPPVQPTPEEPEQPGENPDEGNKPDQPNQPDQKPDTNQPGQNSGEGGNSTIGNSANGSSKSQSVQKKSSMETSSVLPRTGSFIDTTILLVAGILLIFAGVLLMFMRKKLY